MKASGRIRNLIIAAVMILFVAVLLAVPESGAGIIALVMGVAFIAYGIVSLVNYFSKFRYMIGGKRVFYTGAIALDAGLILAGSLDKSRVVILLYLLGLRALSGLVDLLRGMEARRNESHWKFHMFSAAFNIIIVAAGLIFLRSQNTVVYIYCTGLLISAADRILTAFRKTAFVVIA